MAAPQRRAQDCETILGLYVARIQDRMPGSDASARVLAADDHQAFLEVIRQVVDAAEGLRLVGVASTGEEAVTIARELDPDIVLMDVAMDGIGGVVAAREIKAHSPSTLLVLLSATHPDELSREATVCGADEVVWKSELRPSRLEVIWRLYDKTAGATD
jgi:two-component system invasion response regulator UvrY